MSHNKELIVLITMFLIMMFFIPSYQAPNTNNSNENRDDCVVLINESFENGFPPEDWTNIDWLYSYHGVPYHGDNYVSSFNCGATLTTFPIEFGINTTLTFWYQADIPTYPLDFEVYVDDTLVWSDYGFTHDDYEMATVNLDIFSGLHTISFYNLGFKDGPVFILLDLITVTTSPLVVYVDDDFNSSTPGWEIDHFDVIQDGIDAVAENGTVFVYNGTYYENLNIDKAIDLIGEAEKNTIIDGMDSTVIIISSDYVNLSHFTVKNSGPYANTYGIYINSYSYNNISNIIIIENYAGIYLEKSHNNMIKFNDIQDNACDGILMGRSDDNLIYGNSIVDNFASIQMVESCENNSINNNSLCINECYGVRIWPSGCNNNLFFGNIISDNGVDGIAIYSGNNHNLFYNNYFSNNDNVDDSGNNQWNISKIVGTNIIGGSYLGGNYWSDYTGIDTDFDGLGNTDLPYGPGDHLPLTKITPVYVDDDYNSSTPGWQYNHFDVIQDGVDAVAEDGTVYVYNGTYYENVVVNKTIDLIGEDRNKTVIDGGYFGIVMQVISNSTTIESIQILHSGNDSGPGIDSGIFLHSDNNSVSNCVFKENALAILIGHYSDNEIVGCNLINNNLGIWLHGYSNTVIENIIQNTGDMGIMIDLCHHNLIEQNVLINNAIGARFYESYNNTFVNNTISNNWFAGVQLHHSAYYNEVFNNFFEYNDIAIDVFLDATSNMFYHNDFIGNNQSASDDNYNIWDNGYPSGGNYWSDYDGTDADGDGIGDIPYNVSGGTNQDLYPFIEPDGWLKSIDVDQDFYDRGFPVRHALDGDWGAGQSFKLSRDSMTRVDIYMRKFGTPEFNLTFEIHEASINGLLIESFIFEPAEVDNSYQWIILDLEDIITIPDTDYFIVCPPAPSGVTTSFGYEWGYAFGDQYPDGAFWFTRDGGGLWRDLPDTYEFTFRTFGYA